MPEPSAIQSAIALHTSGRLDQAEHAYRAILAASPNDPAAIHMLGMLFSHRGDNHSAEQLLMRSIHIAPQVPDFENNIAMFYQRLGRLTDALAHLRRAIELNPQYVLAHDNMGVVLLGMNRNDEAAAEFSVALSIAPDFAAAHAHLGWAQLRRGNSDQAIEHFRRALKTEPNRADAHTGLCAALAPRRELDEAILHGQQSIQIEPANPETHMNLGGALAMQGRYDEALTCLMRAVELRPQYVEALTNLARVLNHVEDVDRAVAAAQQALAIDPNSVDALTQLSQGLLFQGEFDQGVAAAARAVQLDPDYASGWNHLAMAQLVAGDPAQSIAATRRVIELAPDFTIARSDLLVELHYDEKITRQALFEEHRLYQIACIDPLNLRPMVHTNSRDPERPLRIAYVSPDFREHPIGNFIEPALRCHDRSRFIVSCYSDARHSDDVTRRFRSYASCWYHTANMSEPELAEKIHGAQEDILIDLAGHTAHNRLLTFAQKPAPIQISYLGSLNTTGLNAMDYRITDAIVDPPGDGDALYTEQLIRLPCFFCYHPPNDVPAVSELPASREGRITFGSLNHPAKFNPRVLDLWARLLHAVPDSRLVLTMHSKCVADLHVAHLKQRGIDPSRIEPMLRRPRLKYFELYHMIDIALDTFPFNGHTTSCDALWMGVPVVTVTGNSYVSRTCTSVLSNLGMPQLIAVEQEQYLKIATELAADRDQLRELRESLRQRVLDSTITNAVAFTSNLENAYREVWRKYCGGEKS